MGTNQKQIFKIRDNIKNQINKKLLFTFECPICIQSKFYVDLIASGTNAFNISFYVCNEIIIRKKDMKNLFCVRKDQLFSGGS